MSGRVSAAPGWQHGLWRGTGGVQKAVCISIGEMAGVRKNVRGQISHRKAGTESNQRLTASSSKWAAEGSRGRGRWEVTEQWVTSGGLCQRGPWRGLDFSTLPTNWGCPVFSKRKDQGACELGFYNQTQGAETEAWFSPREGVSQRCLLSGLAHAALPH